MKNVFLRLSSIVASLALMVTVANVNTCCFFFAHQPEVPMAAKKLRKL